MHGTTRGRQEASVEAVGIRRRRRACRLRRDRLVWSNSILPLACAAEGKFLLGGNIFRFSGLGDIYEGPANVGPASAVNRNPAVVDTIRTGGGVSLEYRACWIRKRCLVPSNHSNRI